MDVDRHGHANQHRRRSSTLPLSRAQIFGFAAIVALTLRACFLVKACPATFSCSYCARASTALRLSLFS